MSRAAKKVRVLLTGAYGFVGQSVSPALAEEFELVKAPAYNADTGEGLDLADEAAARGLLSDTRPDVIVHLAAIKNVGRCERDPGIAKSANVQSAVNLLENKGAKALHMVFLSSDYVFNGRQGGYEDTDEPCPCTVYGQTKRQAELAVLRAGGTVVRSGGLYGSMARPGMLFSWAMGELRQERQIEAYTNIFNTPTYVDDLGTALVEMCRHRPGGIYHLVGSERLSRFELLRLLAGWMGVDQELVQPDPCPEEGQGGLAPGDLSLVSSRRSPMEAVRIRGASEVLGRA